MQSLVSDGYGDFLCLRQAALQAEAEQVLVHSGLLDVCSMTGRVVRVGSSVLGLMVAPDIDLMLLHPEPDLSDVFHLIRKIADLDGVRELEYRYRKGTGESPAVRHCLAVTYRPPCEAAEWNVDISIWKESRWLNGGCDSIERRLDGLRNALTDKRRLAILRIKDAFRSLPIYESHIGSNLVYDAVLKEGVESPEAFSRYLLEQNIDVRPWAHSYVHYSSDAGPQHSEVSNVRESAEGDPDLRPGEIPL